MIPDILLQEWDWSTNDKLGISPNDANSGSDKKVGWICKICGYHWVTSIYVRTKMKAGCPACAGNIVIKGKNDLASQFPHLLSEWDYEENTLKPDEVGCRSNRTVHWKKEYKDPASNKSYVFRWTASISHRTVRGSGCPYLSKHSRVWRGYNDLATTHPQLSAEWDYDKNTITPYDVTSGSDKKVFWKKEYDDPQTGKHFCFKWEATISHRALRGDNCPYLSTNPKVWSGFNDLCTTHPKLIEEWDYSLNVIKPEDVTAGSNTRIHWICKYGHSWDAVVSSRANGRGCPVCTKNHTVSYPEKAIFFYAKQFFSAVVPNYKIPDTNNLEIDVFLPEYLLGIEYDGHKWHSDTSRDLKKNEVCSADGIRLYRIREYGLPKLHSTSYDYALSKSPRDLSRVMQIMFSDIAKELSKTIDISIIDVNRDFDKIYAEVDYSYTKNNLLEANTSIITEWDYDSNQGIKPEYIKRFSTKLIHWICPQGHRYQMKVSHKSRGRGCPICSGKKVLPGFNDIHTTHPDLLGEWDYFMNTITPEMISAGSEKRVYWKCPKGHSYYMPVARKIQTKAGCPFCSNKRVLIGFNDILTTNYEHVLDWAYEENTGKPTQYTRGSSKVVNWKCHICGYSWKQSIYLRCRNEPTCPDCRKQKTADLISASSNTPTIGRHRLIHGVNDLVSQYPDVASEWDYSKNTININSVTGGTKTKVFWLCSKCGHSWLASINNRCKNHSGCPECYRNTHRSRWKG